MLNKEFLLATGSQTEGHIKLTVGSANNIYGYSKDKDLLGIFGSISKEPSWNFKGKSCTMLALTSYKKTHLYLWKTSKKLKTILAR